MMTTVQPVLALGLMSGTSLDGVDAALLRTDGEDIVACGPALTLPYDDDVRRRVRAILGKPPAAAEGTVAALARDITRAHARAATQLLRDSGIASQAVTVIGFHGHTILHSPGQGVTVQIGDGDLLAELSGVDVVDDFRSRDIAAGGEGAPLAPLFHAALARAGGLPRPLAVINIGGVANVTWIGGDGAGGGEDRLVAFDAGPGNALIDDWVRAQTGRPYDEDGALASAGRVDRKALQRLLDDPFFARSPPKSLDRGDFDLASLRGPSPGGWSPQDGAATLTALTAEALALSARHFPAPPARWLVTGGGRRNPALMAVLRRALGAEVDAVEAVGWDGDALEAQAFAYLAVRSLKGLPLSLPSTTGADRPVSGGRLHRSRRIA
jgi:anhydro-N-acetylmuramic acid kinase